MIGDVVVRSAAQAVLALQIGLPERLADLDQPQHKSRIDECVNQIATLVNADQLRRGDRYQSAVVAIVMQCLQVLMRAAANVDSDELSAVVDLAAIRRVRDAVMIRWNVNESDVADGVDILDELAGVIA